MKEILQPFLPWIIAFARYFIMAGIPFLLFYILYSKKFSKSKIQARTAKRKDFLREIRHSMFSMLVFVGVFFLLVKSPLGEYAKIYYDLLEYPLWWIPVSLILALVLHDTYFYWMHRLVHHPRIYKKVHLLHHKSTNPSPWASYSFHFYEAVLEALIAPLIIFLVPVHPLVIFLFIMLSFLINVYGHLGYEIAPRWLRKSILFEWITTSTYHNLHHSRFKGNYGLYFRIWDRLLKTENPDYEKEYDKIQARRFPQELVI